MKTVNQFWLSLILAGVFILVFVVGIRIFESVTGANTTEFKGVVIGIEGNPQTLLSPIVETHLRSGRDF